MLIINKVSFDVPSYKHNHEDSFVAGRISVVSPVAGTRDWLTRPSVDSPPQAETEEAGGWGSGGGDSFSLNYGEVQCCSPKALLCLE